LIPSGVDVLRKIDWDFYGYTTSNHLADLHWYPATFVPQLPSVIIKALTSPGETVLDPFCGSGVSLVESLRLGRNAIGIDCTALGCFLSEVKCRLVCANDYEVITNLENFLRELKIHPVSTHQPELQPTDNKILKPDFYRDQFDGFIKLNPQLVQWYHPETLRALFQLKFTIQNVGDSLVRDLLMVCFSSILRATSSQTKSWGHIADNVKPKCLEYKEVSPLLIRQVTRSIRGISELAKDKSVSDNLRFRVYKADARQMDFVLPSSVDLVITSPPYPKMTDYALSQRLTYYWMDWDLDKSRSLEIGSRRRRRQLTFDDDYLSDMEAVLKENRRVLNDGKYLCLILPLFESVAQKRHELISKFVKSVDSSGFTQIAKFERTVPWKRRRHNWPSLGREQIYIWEKTATR